jgi:hypothetical protein
MYLYMYNLLMRARTFIIQVPVFLSPGATIATIHGNGFDLIIEYKKDGAHRWAGNVVLVYFSTTMLAIQIPMGR